MKARTDNKKIGNLEVFLGVLILIIVIALIINSVLLPKDDNKYLDLKEKANTFAEKVLKTVNEEETSTDTYYLIDFSKDDKYLKGLANDCNPYDSFIELKRDKKVRLVCDNLLIEGVYNNRYYIYEIGSWNKENTLGETALLYNYEIEGKKQLDKNVILKEFIDKYNKKENTSIKELEEIDTSKVKILSDLFYREKKLVKEV